MTEYEENMIERLQMENQRLQRETENVGFMEAYFSYIPGFAHAQNNQGFVRDQIKEILSAKEYDILRQTRFTSGKDQIEAYVEIIQRLLKAGVFDSHDLITPVKYTGGLGGPVIVNADTTTKPPTSSSSAEHTCCGKCNTDDDNNVLLTLKTAIDKAIEMAKEEKKD